MMDKINPNPNNLKSIMSFHFIKSLHNLQHSNPECSTIKSRSRKISRSAYASMAIAAGTRRAWSRALIRRLRRGSRIDKLRQWRRNYNVRDRVSRIEKLKRIVPGGNQMDLCSLLEETASYLRCLKEQLVRSNSRRFMPSQADEEAHQLSYLQKHMTNILTLLGDV